MSSIHTITDLIGRTAIIEGRRLKVVEVLTSDEVVILEDAADASAFQENQYGDIHRRVNKTWSIPFFSETDPTRLHPVLEAFLEDETGD